MRELRFEIEEPKRRSVSRDERAARTEERPKMRHTPQPPSSEQRRAGRAPTASSGPLVWRPRGHF